MNKVTRIFQFPEGNYKFPHELVHIFYSTPQGTSVNIKLVPAGAKENGKLRSWRLPFPVLCMLQFETQLMQDETV